MDTPAVSSLMSPPCIAHGGNGACAVAHPRPSRDTPSARWFREEVQVHEADLHAYLRSRFPTLTDAEDIIQDCYARLLLMRERGGPPPITRAYLFVVVRNAALDLIRRRKIVPFDSLDRLPVSSVVEDGTDAADQLCHAEELQLLEDAIRDLPPRCQEVVILCRIHRLSYREIARRLGIAEATVHAQLCFGLKKCRHYFDQRGVLPAPSHVSKST